MTTTPCDPAPLPRAVPTDPDQGPSSSAPGELGLAGAPRVDSAFLTQFGRSGDLVFIACDREISRRYGVSNAGSAGWLRKMTSGMVASGSGIYDLGTIQSSVPADALMEIAEVTRFIAGLGGLPVLVACDHTASIGGLLGSIADLETAPVYVYFDAHYDLGRNWEPGDRLHNGGFVGEILRKRWVSCAINVGGRSPATRLSFPDTADFAGIPASETLATMIECLSPLAGQKIYVSIDADVLDPSVLPGVPCPEPGGMSAEDLLACCQWLGRNCTVIGADLSETLPTQDSQKLGEVLMPPILALRK